MDKRREIRFEKKRKEKELLALDRKKEELRDKAWRPVEYIEVKPIRDGFVRYYSLREDLSGRPDYKYLIEALEACNVSQFCRNKKFNFPKWAYWKTNEFKLSSLGHKEYLKLSERARSFFWNEEKVSWSGAIYNIWHPAIPSWMLVVRVKPHYIRYFKVFDNEAASELMRLENKFVSLNLYSKLDHLYGYRRHLDDWDLSVDRKRAFNKTVKKEIEEEINDFFEAR